jgi:hypothetical protein
MSHFIDPQEKGQLIVQPHGVTDNLWGETMALVPEPLRVHAAQSANLELN